MLADCGSRGRTRPYFETRTIVQGSSCILLLCCYSIFFEILYDVLFLIDLFRRKDRKQSSRWSQVSPIPENICHQDTPTRTRLRSSVFNATHSVPGSRDFLAFAVKAIDYVLNSVSSLVCIFFVTYSVVCSALLRFIS